MAILTYNGAEVFLIITKVEGLLMSNLSVDWDIRRVATFVESGTTTFVKSSCCYFYPFVLSYSFKRGESLFSNFQLVLFIFYPQFQTVT